MATQHLVESEPVVLEPTAADHLETRETTPIIDNGIASSNAADSGPEAAEPARGGTSLLHEQEATTASVSPRATDPPPINTILSIPTRDQDEHSCVSEVTQHSDAASLFRGPLYPSATSVCEATRVIPGDDEDQLRAHLPTIDEDETTKVNKKSLPQDVERNKLPREQIDQNECHRQDQTATNGVERMMAEVQDQEKLIQDPSPMGTTSKGEEPPIQPKKTEGCPTINESNSTITLTSDGEDDDDVAAPPVAPALPDWTSEIRMMPEPLPLPIPPRERNDSLPGAFPVVPLGAFRQAPQNVQDDEVGTDDVELGIPESPDTARNDDDDDDYESPAAGSTELKDDELTQATPVDFEELEELAQAMPLDMNRTKRNRERQQLRHYWTLAVWIVALAVVFCLVGVLMRKRGNAIQVSSSSTPSFNPSTAPSTFPTASPTDILDTFLANLPEYTIESLKDPFSAQSKALDWLNNHQNITGLPEWRRRQLFALATFFFAFAGPSWPKYIRRSWLADTVDECNWFSSNYGSFDENGTYHEGYTPHFDGADPEILNYGFCNSTTGEVVDISLNELGLAGMKPTIPPEISLLTSLEYIYILSSDFHGELEDLVPSELYTMKSLKDFAIYQTNISGTIPSAFGLMTNLEVVYLDTNTLSGTIPSEIGLLVNLVEMHLYSNLLSGKIPSEFGELAKLDEEIEIDDNFLTGTVPTELGKLGEIRSLWLAMNDLTGTLPSELGNMVKLDTLKVFDNLISGTIPSELGLLTDLARVDLSDLPLITGTLPTQFGALANLTELDFNGTSRLSGTLPDSLCQLQNSSCKKELWEVGLLDCSLVFDCSNQFCGCDCECS